MSCTAFLAVRILTTVVMIVITVIVYVNDMYMLVVMMSDLGAKSFATQDSALHQHL